MRQSFVHGAHDLLIHQHPVGVFHPIFAKITQFRGNQPIAETELCPPHLNHAAPLSAFDAAPGAANHD